MARFERPAPGYRLRGPQPADAGAEQIDDVVEGVVEVVGPDARRGFEMGGRGTWRSSRAAWTSSSAERSYALSAMPSVATICSTASSSSASPAPRAPVGHFVESGALEHGLAPGVAHRPHRIVARHADGGFPQAFGEEAAAAEAETAEQVVVPLDVPVTPALMPSSLATRVRVIASRPSLSATSAAVSITRFVKLRSPRLPR